MHILSHSIGCSGTGNTYRKLYALACAAHMLYVLDSTVVGARCHGDLALRQDANTSQVSRRCKAARAMTQREGVQNLG